MTERDVIACDEAFFEALLAGDPAVLAAILTDDFRIVDVIAGQIAAREELLAAMGSGELTFVAITRHPDEATVRLRESAAVLVGRTRMRMSFRGEEVAVSSRYTHVFARDGERWRLWSAQGTPIPDAGSAA